MSKCTATLATMFAITLTAGPVQAATFNWTNDGAGTDWGTPANWDGPAGFVPGPNDEAIIDPASGYPTSSSNRTVDALTIKDGAELDVSTFDLTTDVLTIEGNAELTVASNVVTVEARSGLTIEEDGEISIQSGTVKLRHGGSINLDGTIIFEGSGSEGSLLLDKGSGAEEATVFVIPDSTTGKIVGNGTNEQGVIEGFDRNTPVLVVGAGVQLLGKLTIDVTLVNNGVVHADREGDLILDCNSKAGNGLWKVSGHANAKLESRASIAGGPDSIIEIEDGVFKVTSDWVSCGSVWLLKNAGKLDVGIGGTLRTGTGTGECVCGG